MLPRHAGDILPRTPAGILVAVADRLDSLVGLFAAGAAPSASADPFALRRSAYGMLEVRSLPEKAVSLLCHAFCVSGWLSECSLVRWDEHSSSLGRQQGTLFIRLNE